MTTPLRCVLLSETLDLARLFGPVLSEIADAVEVVTHPVREGAEAVRLALAWFPPADAFSRYPNLEAVCSIAAGVDSLLACPGLPPDLPIVRVVDPEQARAMSCFVLWHVIGHQRRFRTYAENQARAVWMPLGQQAAGEITVGLLGYGRMGAQVAADLAALGFKVLAWSRSERPPEAGVAHLHGADGLAALLPRTDVLVNLLPLTPETRGILNAALFRRLKPGATLVQVGRGDHLVEADLLAALDEGTLGAAALDVFAVEPLPAAHPFWRHPRIVITPHEACDASPQAVAAMLRATAEALRMGAPIPHAVDRRRGY
ncbi:2-hydroxyacid dehydrogenase [Methylobacterium nodulans]|uniref:D-isomer specific 2-hydroxyacid dehydrogenase NAD-binding n=1 Tax=Methylobacterium nodulans (strain LMG 21967 / CNCM I-2342 / ORS 2060) TaxID=460265 RepID=B8INH7_METNO|nr:glyoxylate/hydroxypyruvate reductase A [Methylobacterium nodulans]ACL56503.1 D-isomer specific 2-hydroxyacid dehydrogenase NAD-binding [Methylobacterium nodulans ORS 2060]